METRHIIAGIIVIVTMISGAILGSYYLFMNYPHLIGIESNKAFSTDMLKTKIEQAFVQDTIPVVNTVEITIERLRKFEAEIRKSKIANKDIDSLKKFTKKLQDSIPVLIKDVKQQLDSVKKIYTRLKKSKLNNEKLLDSISFINLNLTKKDGRITELSKIIEDQEQFLKNRMDSLEIAHYKNFAKIYNNSAPPEIAKILEQIDERDAAMILRYMRKKNAGKVLDAMNKESAAAILLLGVTELKEFDKKE